MEVDLVKVDRLMGWLNKQQSIHKKMAGAAKAEGYMEPAGNESDIADVYGEVIAKMEETFAGAAAGMSAMPQQANLTAARKGMAALQELASYGKVNKLLTPGVRSYYAGMETALEAALALLKAAER